MNRKFLKQALIALCFALVLLSPRAGTADTTPRIAGFTPGEGSRLSSPIEVSAQIKTEGSGLVRVELLDKKGQAISRQLLRVDAGGEGDLSTFWSNLSFESSSEEAEGLLILSLLDSFNRPIAVRSARVTLLSGGESVIQPPQQTEGWMSFSHPEPRDIFTGGSLTVSGTVTPFSESPLLVELIADDGRVIGTAQVRVPTPGQSFDFETALIYYYIQSFTDARLIVRQSDPAYNATILLDSILIGVAP